jgi:hypothetical protein
MPFQSIANPSTVPNDPQKIVAYVMPDRGAGHKFLVLRRTVKNAKGRYVTGDEVLKVGLFYPTAIASTRDDLALILGRAILSEAGIP